MESNLEYCSKRSWITLWLGLGSSSYVRIMEAYQYLLKCYLEPHRKYHNLEHINHCLTEFNTAWHLASDPDLLELAIWYHDIVYNINADDNEELSALLAEKVMTDSGLPIDSIEKVKNIILATKHDKIPESFDAKLMLDIDISNLGQVDKFEETNRLVREEFSSVPQDLFVAGRVNILSKFLNRPNIYLTEFFQEKYENIARDNILKLK